MWCHKGLIESEDDFEALADVDPTNIEFPQSQEDDAISNRRMASNVHHLKLNAWFQEKSLKKLKLGANVTSYNTTGGYSPNKDRVEDMPINQNEYEKSNPIMTKHFVEKIIGMTSKFSNFEERFAEMETSLDIKLDKMETSLATKLNKMESSLDIQLDKMEICLAAKLIKMETSFAAKLDKTETSLDIKLDNMEKMLICGQETVDRRLLEIEDTLTRRIIKEIENKLMEKIVEEIDSKLKKMYESLHRRQKKCIDQQNTLNEKLNENSENYKFDDKLKQVESSIKILLKDITEQIRDISLAGKTQNFKDFETDLMSPQNTIKKLKPRNQVPSSQFSQLPSPAVSLNDALTNGMFKKPQIPFRKRPKPLQPILKQPNPLQPVLKQPNLLHPFIKRQAYC